MVELGIAVGERINWVLSFKEKEREKHWKNFKEK